MNLHLSEQQVMLQESFARLFQIESTPARVRAAEPLGFDGALWDELVAAGAPLMRVTEAAEGSGLPLMDAVLIAEAAGRHLASAPLLECIVAARLLSLADSPVSTMWLAAVAAGDIVTLAVEPVRQGRAQLVPAGAVAKAVIGLEGDRLKIWTLTDGAGSPSNLGTLPVAALDLSSKDAAVLLEGDAAIALWSAGVEELKLLVAAMAVAMARKSLEDAGAYSKERQAFDRPIGGYQGVAHPLADAITDIDGAQLLIWRAASAGSGNASASRIAMAHWWSIRSTAGALVKAMRVFGGYGVSMEYDAQLYFRRARAWSMVFGDPAKALRLAGDRLWGGLRDSAPDAGETTIDFGLGEKAEAFADAARTFFEANMTPELKRFAFETDDGDHPFNQALAQAGFLYPDWPSEHGGQDRDPYEMAALQEVYTEFGWPKVPGTVTHMVGKILMHFASDEAKSEILPRLATGTANVSLGYSEPSCGSDIFAARTRAVRDGDDWVIDGQKMFTSQGHLAQYALLITRTDPDLPKHAGLTLFIVPLDLPGYEVHEVKTLGAERTNITYYTAMRVPDRYRVGAVNGGAKVMAAALTLEQSGGDFFVGALQNLQKHALAWANTPGPDQVRPIDDPEVRARLAAAQTRIDVSDLLDKRSVWAFSEKVGQKYFGPMAKLFASEALVSCTTDLVELTAPWSLLQGMTDLGAIELETRKAVQATIYGGTSEVQRSIIAESALGMPRTRS